MLSFSANVNAFIIALALSCVPNEDLHTAFEVSSSGPLAQSGKRATMPCRKRNSTGHDKKYIVYTMDIETSKECRLKEVLCAKYCYGKRLHRGFHINIRAPRAEYSLKYRRENHRMNHWSCLLRENKDTRTKTDLSGSVSRSL